MVGLPITGLAGRNNRIATHPTPASVTPRPIRRTGRPRDTTGPPRRVPRGLVITTRRGERTLRSGVTAVTGAGVTGRVRGPDTRPRTARARELRTVPDRIAASIGVTLPIRPASARRHRSTARRERRP